VSPVKARKPLSAEQKHRRQGLAKKRAELDTNLAKTRDIADTAFAEVFQRPAFHNYGRYNETNPWVSRRTRWHPSIPLCVSPRVEKPRFRAPPCGKCRWN
jgi:hypothetical protein